MCLGVPFSNTKNSRKNIKKYRGIISKIIQEKFTDPKISFLDSKDSQRAQHSKQK